MVLSVLSAYRYHLVSLPPRMPEIWDDVPLSAGPETLRKAQNALEDHIASLQEVLAALKSRQNNFPLISKLLPETLIQIFTHLVEPSPCLSTKGPFCKVRPAWISASQVSRAWRSLALSCGRLWGNISVHYGDAWVKELTRRARDSPLSLDATGIFHRKMRDDFGGQVFQVAVSRAHLVSHLQLDFPFFSHDARAVKWIELIPRLPALRSLSILGFFRHRPAMDFLARRDVLLNLRSLRIHWPDFTAQPRAVGIFRQLEVLVFEKFDAAPQLDEVLQILNRLHRLRELTLRQFRCSCDGLALRPEAVKLPLLERLHLQAAPSHCSAVLSNLALPQFTNITVFVSPYTVCEDSQDDCRKLVESLSTRATLTSTYAQALVDKNYLTWTGYRSHNSDPNMWIKLGGETADLRRYCDWLGPGIIGWLSLFHGALPIDSLTLTGSTGSEVLAELNKPEMCMLMPTLQELVLQDMEHATSHPDLLLWLQEREKLRQRGPARITLAGDPMDDLSKQMSRMCGPDGFWIYNGKRLVKAHEGRQDDQTSGEGL